MITLVVLYVADLDASHRFYSLLGLEFAEVQHERGPVHYSATVPTGTVLQLHPAGDRPVTRTRLAFEVRGRAAVAAALRTAGFTVKRQSLVIDPDGNRVELIDSEAITPVATLSERRDRLSASDREDVDRIRADMEREAAEHKSRERGRRSSPP